MSVRLEKHFLIATQSLQKDDYFAHSVVYIYKHDANGAAGFILNRPIEVKFRAVLEHLDIKHGRDDLDNSLIYLGGPADQDVGSLVFTPDNIVRQDSEVCFDSSRDRLEQLLSNAAVSNFMFVLGASIWKPNQLETELAGDNWLVVPSDSRIIFDTPVPLRWREAAKLLGVSQLHLSESGNA